MQRFELPPEQIIFNISENEIKTLRKTTSCPAIIGQERAIKAIQLGLGIQEKGYNIFIMGPSGSGKRTILQTLLKDFEPNLESLHDIGYVYNFKKSFEPLALFFKPGTISHFKQSLHTAIKSIQRQIFLIRQSTIFETARKKIIDRSEKEELSLFHEIEKKFLSNGFKVELTNGEKEPPFYLIPLFKDKETTFENLELFATQGKISQKDLQNIKEKYSSFNEKMDIFIYTIAKNRKRTEKKLNALIKKYAEPIIDNELALLTNLYNKDPNHKKIATWLLQVRKDLLLKTQIWSKGFKSTVQKKDFFNRYSVNIICEHNEQKKYIVQEELPNFRNLFGSIEINENLSDKPINAHMCIQAGAVHKAFGGFLVLRVQDLLQEEGSWQNLKKVLHTGKIEIQNSPASTSHIVSAIKAQVLPINFKTILIGQEQSYDCLYQEDSDFKKLFKICAEFESEMPRTQENMQYFISFIDSFIQKKSYLPIDNSGIAEITRQAARLIEDRTKISTQFTLITDLLSEANYHARKTNKKTIDASTILHTISYKRSLYDMPEKKFFDLLHTKYIVLDFQGKTVGRVNGLAFKDRGYLSFGIPVAITAHAAPGNKGVINIETESGLSGEIFDKAHLIIQGLLIRKYAQDIPLALSASISIEQSYEGIDGDSASCAFFYALVSAITNIPFRQDIAITGSLNQIGDVQPVGGISEKIDSFFDACLLFGLTKTQGVIIPNRNCKELILSQRVEQAIKKKEFHIWAISEVDEGIEILSGVNPKEFKQKVQTVLQNNAKKVNMLVK